ncbi:hypothetical protein P2318_33280 [Myxococcaceae bacterium GXIMD 01537]
MPTNANTDWKQFHKDLLAATPIPATKHEVTGPGGHWEIRDLYVDLAELYARVAEASPAPVAVIVCADVVRMPANWSHVMDGVGLVVFARRLEVSAPSPESSGTNAPPPPANPTARFSLNYRVTHGAKLMLFASELGGTIVVNAITGASTPQSWTLTGFGSNLGVEFSWNEATAPATSAPRKKDWASVPDNFLSFGSAGALSLGSVYEMATALFTSKPDVAGSMLQWVKKASAGSPSAASLQLQSSALLLALQSQSTGGPTFVPSLSRAVYVDQSRAFIEAADAYDQQYQRFSDKNENIAARKAAAQVMQGNYRDAAAYADALIAQADDNHSRARASLEAVKASLASQQNQVETAGILFRNGLKNWEEDAKTQAALTLTFTSIGMLANILTAIGKGGAGIDGSSEAGKGMESVANIGESLEKLTSAMEAASEFFETLDKLAKLDATRLPPALTMPEPDALDPNDPSGGLYWSTFQIEADASVQSAIDAGVDGAREYKAALDLLVVYGQAQASAMLAVARTAQELARLRLQKWLATSQQARLDDYIATLDAAREPNDQMMQMLFERYLDIKRWLFISVQSYAWAYRYWALRDSRVKPSVTKSVAELKADLGTVVSEYGSALQSFNPPPQSFSGLTRSFTGPSLLAALRQSGSAICHIALSDEAFAGFDRVRIKTVRAWLIGATATRSVYVLISNSGVYADRLKGTNRQFVAEALQRGFRYQLPGTILLDGQVFDEEQYAYFMPTPFTDWTLTVPAAQNMGLNLAGLTEIRLEFSGSAIAG